jgi:probable LLM family oxidoreductase
MTSPLQLGLDTFCDVSADRAGERVHPAQVIRDVVEQGVLAEGVGIDVFNIGEHHRDDYAVTAPEILLAAIAARTERIILGTAVTVLSSDDPVRVQERFATLDAVARGRAEITVGRGSFTESFPLFGLDLADYERLFSEKLDLLAALRSDEPVSWQGSIRPPLRDAVVHPRPEHGPIPTWIGVGGSPESVVRAARYRMPLMLAVIGGDPARFAPYADLYRRALEELGAPELPIGVHAPGYVAETDAQAREELFPHFKANRDRIGRERGWGPVTREQFDAEADHGALFVGAPETVAQKIAATVRTLGLSRFDLKYSNGPQPHEQLMHAIELYGEAVVPRVRELLG